MERIFISYARNHEEFARKLATSLSADGASIWLDVKDIPAGMCSDPIALDIKSGFVISR
jgi:hypothetical protein